MFVAEALLGVGLGNFASLVGAASVSAFSFYLPWLLYLRCFAGRLSRGKQLLCWLWFFFGLGLAAAGVVASVQQMASMAGAGLFEAPCHQNAFYMGRYATDGADGEGGYSAATGLGSFYQTYYREACVAGRIDCAQAGACCHWSASLRRVVCPDGEDGA